MEQGTSIPDSDGDGFIDSADLCPNQPETFNNILDLDGCPDDAVGLADTDSDGYPDGADSCPDHGREL